MKTAAAARANVLFLFWGEDAWGPGRAEETKGHSQKEEVHQWGHWQMETDRGCWQTLGGLMGLQPRSITGRGCGVPACVETSDGSLVMAS